MNGRVLIIGAGIGGLTAAVALTRKGVAVRVFERAEELLPLGAGLSLWPNAMRCLQDLNVSEHLVQVGSVVNRLQFRTKEGVVLKDLPLEQLARSLGAPTICVHRSDLQQVLLEPLDGGIVTLGAELAGIRQDDDGVTAWFVDGRAERGAALIGADGLLSTVRAQTVADGPPRYAGYGASLGVTNFTHPQLPRGLAFESWGLGARFGLWPCGERLYWYFSSNQPEPLRSVVRGRKTELLQQAASWHEPVPEIIESTEEDNILMVSSFDRPPVNSWGKGRVTLLGDAAHPMTPNLGQGACQAIEDAIVLSESFAAATDPAEGLKCYVRRRLKRAGAVVKQAHRFGVFGQTERRIVYQAWNGFVKALPVTLVLRQMASQIGRTC